MFTFLLCFGTVWMIFLLQGKISFLQILLIDYVMLFYVKYLKIVHFKALFLVCMVSLLLQAASMPLNVCNSDCESLSIREKKFCILLIICSFFSGVRKNFLFSRIENKCW